MEVEKCNASVPAVFDGSEMEQRLIALIRTRPKGISDENLNNETLDIKPIQRAEIINKLLSQGHIKLFKQAGLLFYRFNDSIKPAKGSTNEEKIVYKIIEEAGNKGIWIGDIRKRTNLIHTQLQKILKNLEAKQLVKVVKSVTNNKRVYMLYHVEPDISIAGCSAWYQDSEIETEFVDVLSQQCYRFLEHKRERVKGRNTGPVTARKAMLASSEEIWKFISDSGISKVKLSVSNIEMILNTLIYDGKVEKISSEDDKNLYKSIQPLVTLPGLMRNPCGLCPVRRQCCDEGIITSIKCQYLREWLE